MKLDMNCYSGNWPFFRIRYNTVEKLSELHSRCGIEGGFVSSCEAIFYQDPYEAELQLSKELSGTKYMHAMTLNPTTPGWKDELARCVNALNIKAVRLMPGFHNYLLTDPVMDEVLDALRQYQLPMLLTLRIRDERSAWMFTPRKIAIDEMVAFLQKSQDITTLIACIRFNELAKIKDLLLARNNLFVDISGLKDNNFVLESACELVGAEKIVYGSSAPLLNLMSTTMMVDTANLPENVRMDIFSGKNLLQKI